MATEPYTENANDVKGRFGSPASRLEAALAYAAFGWSIFPCPPDAKMSYKSARHNGGVRWGATKNPTEIRRDWSRWPNSNIGLPTGEQNGLFVVETDTPKAHGGVDGAASLTRLISNAGRGIWPETRTAQSPSGSTHHYFLWPSDKRTIYNSTSKLGAGIDLRASGGMVIIPPSVRRDGVYRWVKDVPVAPAPGWLLSFVAVKPRPPSTADRTELEYNSPIGLRLLIREAMKHVPVQTEWNERNRIAMALWACTGGDTFGLALWDEWLQRSGKYNYQMTRKRWAALGRCPPSDIGFGTIMFQATRAQPKWLDELDSKLEAAVNR